MSGDPRPSATMCVLYQGEADIEVLMVRRSASARFMAGAWVFPGGVLDPEDYDAESVDRIEGLSDPGLGPWLAAGFREVVEETAVWLAEPPFVSAASDDVFARARAGGIRFAGDRIAYFANWITPTMVPVRFDARFFIAAISDKVVPRPDDREIDAAEYIAPHEALRRAEDGEWLVPFPTQSALEQLAGFESVDAALDDWRHREVIAVRPRMRVAANGALEVVVPGDPGFDQLGDAEPDPAVLRRAAQVAAQRGRPIVEAASDRH